MAVIPKYQLEALFEAGDLMTQASLKDFIDSAYNPTLVAGSNVTITKVTTPSGDTLTISSTGGGGGSPVIAGPGIDITTIGSNDQVSINLDTSQTNIIINGSNELTFAGVHVQDEGIAVGTYKTINFIGDDVLAEDSGTPGKVNVYIPTPTFASNFNKTNGTTNGTVTDNITERIVRISSPTTEGTPFATNGWAGTNQPAYTSANGSVVFSTAQQVTGFSGDASGNAKIIVKVYDADGVNVLETFDTFTVNALYQNQTFTSPSGDITVQISNYAADTSKWKAEVDITVIAGDILANNGRDGGRYHVFASMITDTATDGGGTHSYTQSDVFFDTNLSTPAINGNITVIEKAGSVISKHLSGVEYYVAGSKFLLDVTDIDNFNANTQGRSNAAQWNFRTIGTDWGLPTLQLEAWNPSVGTMVGWTNQYNVQNVNYDYNDWAITSSNWRFRNTDATATANVYDPWGTGPTNSSSPYAILVDTYSTTGNSNSLRERFDDEEFRLTRGSSSYTTWNSVPALGSGISNQTGSFSPFDDACVVGSNLVRADRFFADNGNSPAYATIINNLTAYQPDESGVNPNYSGYTDTATYHRLFETTTQPTKVIASFELAFTGSFASGNAYNDLVNENIRIYIRKAAAPVSTNIGHSAVPHSLHGSAFNSGNYSDDPTGAIPLSVDAVNGSAQCRTGTTPGNTITGTFGGSNAYEGFYVEIQIANPAVRIDQIVATLVFSDGTSQSG